MQEDKAGYGVPSPMVSAGASEAEQAKRKAGGTLRGEKRRRMGEKKRFRSDRTVFEYWSTSI
jgi:hypothetical protein